MPLIPAPGPIVPALAVVASQSALQIRLPEGGLKAGKATLAVVAPERPTATLDMPSMAMMKIAPPAVAPGERPGEYRLTMELPHGGAYRLTLKAGTQTKSFDLQVKGADDMDMAGMEGMDMASMQGILGDWSMAREGSGTSWLPDDSPMFMKGLGKAGRFNLVYMGNFSLNYTDSNVAGGRGPHEFYSNSMPMLMARRGLANGDTLGFRVMGSLDPVFNGQFGAPNLFQTGETARGQTLVDRQHPHDLIAEVSATYTKKLGENRAFLYLAPIGEPAIAGSMYLMRPSGMEDPEAPITHHWYDSSHITFGVVTAGYEIGSRYKIDGSFFNGKEPDENRYSPDNLRLDSSTIRFTANPSKALSMNVSYAALHEPERQEEGNQHRLDATVHFGRLYRNGGALALTGYFGRDLNEGREPSDAYLAEGAYYRGDWSYYLRYENVQKDELGNVPEGRHTVSKWTFGGTRDLAHRGGFDFGVGAYAGLYAFGSSLNDAYGSFPVSLGVYFRVRPSRMSMGGMKM